MSKKKLNADSIRNELTGKSVFFQKKEITKKPNHIRQKTVSANHDTKPPSNHDTTVSRYHETMIETVRKAVKQFGKEAATHRFTVDEKNAIADLVFTNKRLGIRTSENEIARIAVNFILEDQLENGENSILAKVLKVLHE
jgi:hypothetical protein